MAGFPSPQVRPTRERPYAKTISTPERTLRRLCADSRRRQHWALRDNAGVWLSRFGMQIAVVDERTFTIETPSPTPMVLLALSAPSDPPFIMRERDAMNPAEKAVTEIVGSGPFRFVASEYVPGSRIIYERNPDYVPREEPASGFAGESGCMSIAWNSASCPTPPPLRRRCRKARSICGRHRRSICYRCCESSRIW